MRLCQLFRTTSAYKCIDQGLLWDYIAVNCADHDAPMSGTWVEVVKQRATLDPGDPLKNWLIYVLEI